MSRGFIRFVVRRHGPLQRSSHAVLVVLANVYAGQLPQLCQIQRLVKSSLVDGRFAKEAKRYLISLFVFRSKGHARGQRNLSADNRVPAEKVDALVEQVHRTSLAARTAARLTDQLCHHRSGRNALREPLSVLAIAGDDIVIPAHRRDGTDTDRLLADVQLTEAANFSEAVGFRRLLFEPPNQQHLAKEIDERLAG